MRFKVDENLPAQCVGQLRQAGHDALLVHDQGLTGAPDPRIAAVCADERRVLVSLDLDFADIRTYPRSESAGIVVFRLRSQDATTLHQVVGRPLTSASGLSSRLALGVSAILAWSGQGRRTGEADACAVARIGNTGLGESRRAFLARLGPRRGRLAPTIA